MLDNILLLEESVGEAIIANAHNMWQLVTSKKSGVYGVWADIISHRRNETLVLFIYSFFNNYH